jgi:glycosyltransferase involved in cell wall biosynthesis
VKQSIPSAGPFGSSRPLRIGFFGAFHPMSDRAGAASTGMAVLLALSSRVGRILVLGPRGARPPDGIAMERAEVIGIWEPDRLGTLIRSLRELTRRGSELDGYIFSIYPTAFGRRPMPNAFGLGMPVLVHWLTRRPVVVFMHNFVETQDLTKLGYDVSPIALRAAAFLERRLGRRTRVAAGLRSQAETAEQRLGVPVRWIPMRFVESVPGLLTGGAHGSEPHPAPPPGGPLRVLLFGTWGPQKDLIGALTAVRAEVNEGPGMHVTIAGGANPNFPEYGRQLAALAAELPSSGFRFIGHVADSDVPALFRSNDVLLLPYNASGGYSGVMNLGAAYGIRVIAYDQPQLRECAAGLGLAAVFVPAGDGHALVRALWDGRAGPAVPSSVEDPTEERLQLARAGVEGLIDLLESDHPLGRRGPIRPEAGR